VVFVAPVDKVDAVRKSGGERAEEKYLSADSLDFDDSLDSGPDDSLEMELSSRPIRR